MVTSLMPTAAWKVLGRTAWIIGTATPTLRPQTSEFIQNKSGHIEKKSLKAYLSGGGVNVNEAVATSLSNKFSNAATVMVHWVATFAADSAV